MTEFLSSNYTLDTVKQALDGLAQRQEIISHNLANVDTPGYQAKNVNFEAALKGELQRGRTLNMNGTKEGHLSPQSGKKGLIQTSPREGGTPRADGNNVNIDLELLQMSETNLRFESLTTLLNKKYRLLRDIANRR